jgi:hypothetical protein
MAKAFKCNTRSPAGNLILGVLFLLCALFLIVMPCLGVAGTVVGAVTLPKDGHEALGTLCAFGVCLALLVITFALGVLCLNATLLPKTLEVTEDGIELRWFAKRLGHVPFANMKGVTVKTRAMAGETANTAFWQAFFAGGLIGGLIAQRRFDPNEPIGFIIKLIDADDPDTSWPRGLFKSAPHKRLDVHYYWKLPHARLVQKIDAALVRYKGSSPQADRLSDLRTGDWEDRA